MACLLLAAQVNSYMLSTPAGVQLQRHAEPQMATKVSRRKEGLDTQVDREKLYEPVEALGIVKKTATAKFVETIELHGNLNLDPKYNDQQIRTTVSLPSARFAPGKCSGELSWIRLRHPDLSSLG